MEENTNTLRKKAEKLYKQNKFEEIIALLTDEELETRKDAKLYGWRAKASYLLEKYIAETMVFAEKTIAVDPTYYIGYYVRALAWADRKEHEKAVKDYTKAIELDPNFADAYYYRGLAWQNQNENNKAIADFDKAIECYSKTIKINSKDAELYLRRGNAWYNKMAFGKAIDDYDIAIELNSDFANAYYCRGLALVAINEKDYNKTIAYDKAIIDYTKAIRLKPDYAAIYYYDRGNAWKAKKIHEKAIADYTKAIKKNSRFENAYYYRGLVNYNRGLERKEKNNGSKGNEKHIEVSKKDFKRYLKLTSEDDDIGVRYANYYLKKLAEIKDTKLSEIIVLVDEVKKILRVDDDLITHYTKLSAMKNLILAENSKLWIFEGNFMNDPSEGTEFFCFLYSKDKWPEVETTEIEKFVPKPFIGSFIPKDMNNDLNMWRFYGKEDGVEAKGCAIVLRTQEFIEDIKNSLSNEKNKEARIDDESDINFYRVVYLKHKSADFKIPNLKKEKVEEFKGKMVYLKEKVEAYKKAKSANIISLEEYLNSIAFLFKRADYENENEVRLVMSGIEFEKKFCEKNKDDKSVNPPLVYIELVPIKKSVEQITLGPKADKANEWASALRYSYKGEEKVPKIEISHLPYK
jgi:tetratricopeptide (TPR) repeat protein